MFASCTCGMSLGRRRRTSIVATCCDRREWDRESEERSDDGDEVGGYEQAWFQSLDFKRFLTSMRALWGGCVDSRGCVTLECKDAVLVVMRRGKFESVRAVRLRGWVVSVLHCGAVRCWANGRARSSTSVCDELVGGGDGGC